MKKLFLHAIACGLLLLICSGCYHVWKPLPEGLDHQGQPLPCHNARFLKDMTYVTESGDRQSDQEIFTALFEMIARAEKLILVDMFLFNDFVGQGGPPYRPLCNELTTALINRKQAIPDIRIIVITDPINTVYGGLRSNHLNRLRDADIEVIITDLDRLRDSNPLWSSPWRLIVKPFGNSPGKETLSNPFGKGKVSLRSWLRLINFKANHRKVAVMDSGSETEAQPNISGADSPGTANKSRSKKYKLCAWVSSANAHDGSSAHGNVGLVFEGRAALDLLKTEEAVMAYTSPDTPLPSRDLSFLADALPCPAPPARIQILTEGAVGDMTDQLIDQSQPGDSLDLVMFYLADRNVVSRLKKAARRGVTVRVVLDPNKDAFGRIKKGLPNRQTGSELVKAGIPLRWADTHGEQSHAKLLVVHYADGTSKLLIGSANFTRRNLRNYNLETNALLISPGNSPLIKNVATYVNQLWTNPDGKQFTTDFSVYRDDSLWKKLKYRLQEKTGLCTW